jgi:cytochrome o ubiquinol oxidase operon protein cyoD
MAGGHKHAAQANHHESPKMYIIGYILSLVLTVAAFWLVLAHVMSTTPLVITILALATLQIFVQLFFFMHVTEGEGPNYHGMALLLGAVFVITVVFGSLWIMSFNAQVQ